MDSASLAGYDALGDDAGKEDDRFDPFKNAVCPVDLMVRCFGGFLSLRQLREATVTPLIR